MKRIVVITLPHDFHISAVKSLRDGVVEKLDDDYFVFVMQGIQGQPVSFQLFTDQNIPPIELEELKALLLK